MMIPCRLGMTLEALSKKEMAVKWTLVMPGK